MTTTDIDAVFDLAADATPSNTPSSTPPQDTPENGTENDAAATSAAAGTAVYSNVVATYKASEVGDANPEGTLTISEFAGHLTLENLTKHGKGLEGIVDKATIYTGVRGTRDPLPVVLVFADDDDQSDQKTAKVYLPVDKATEVFNARKPRGEGNTSTSKRTQEELLEDAAKKAITLAKTQKRFDRVKSQLDTVTAQLNKYHGWLADFYKGTEIGEFTEADGTKRPETQVEANKRALNDAIAAKAAEIEEAEALKSDAEKSDIPDEDK